LPSPTSPLRKKIFALAAAKFNFDAGVQLDELAKITVGFSGADIMNMANEAAIIAAKEDCEFITQEHLLSAHEKVTIGVENRSLKISEEERKITAYHESGHALVALLMPQATPLKRLTCIPRGNALGVTRCYEDVDKFSKNEKLLFANLSVFFGGLVAEEILTGSHDTGSADDLEKATTLAEMMVCDFGMSPLGNLCIRGRYVSNEKVSQAITELLSKAEKAARDVLENHKAELECLANKLLEAETMSGDEVRTLIAEVERAKTSHVATQELG
jgi:cell division protease FtsH